jgi:hypothetical protein
MYIDTSSAWTSFKLKRLRVKKRNTARCSLEKLNRNVGYLLKILLQVVTKFWAKKIYARDEELILWRMESLNRMLTQERASYLALHKLSNTLF